MDEEVWKNMEWIMEKIKPFIAIIVLVLIVFCSYNVYKNNQLQKEVKQSCGYQKNEKVYCVCDKAAVSQIDIPGNPYYNNSLNFSIDEIPD